MDTPARKQACCMQIGVIAGLFGVAATQSKTPSRFHETYRLTSLVKTPYADILDQDTDPVVCTPHSCVTDRADPSLV